MPFQNDFRNGAIRNTNLNDFGMRLAKCELHKTERGGGKFPLSPFSLYSF